MKNAILRYDIDATAPVTILSMPHGAIILEVKNDAMRGGSLSLFVQADLDAEKERRALYRVSTGEEIIYPMSDLDRIGSAIAVAPSASTPGALSARHVHYFEAMGDTAQHLIATADLLAD
jgi:hypothetical protein